MSLPNLSISAQLEIYLTSLPQWMQDAYTADAFVRGLVDKAFHCGVPQAAAVQSIAYEIYLKLKVCHSQIHKYSKALGNPQTSRQESVNLTFNFSSRPAGSTSDYQL